MPQIEEQNCYAGDG